MLTQSKRLSLRSLTGAERERGLRALAELEQLDQELRRRRGGELFPPSWTLLDQAREERMGELLREQ